MASVATRCSNQAVQLMRQPQGAQTSGELAVAAAEAAAAPAACTLAAVELEQERERDWPPRR